MPRVWPLDWLRLVLAYEIPVALDWRSDLMVDALVVAGHPAMWSRTTAEALVIGPCIDHHGRSQRRDWPATPTRRGPVEPPRGATGNGGPTGKIDRHLSIPDR